MDSNHRKRSWQIYSLLPLATREPVLKPSLRQGRIFKIRTCRVLREVPYHAWSWRWELNPQPTDYKSVALPLSYTSWEKMAIRRGLEPLTSSVTGWHSNQLNYRTILLFVFKKVGGPSGFRTPDRAVMSRLL